MAMTPKERWAAQDAANAERLRERQAGVADGPPDLTYSGLSGPVVSVENRLGKLDAFADFVMCIAYVMGIAGTVAGIAVSMISVTTMAAGDGSIDPVTVAHYPYVAIGVGIVAAGLAQAVVVGFLASWAKTYIAICRQSGTITEAP
jgi:hypothetical protein